MCGSTKAPKVVERDPIADQRAAEARAATESNMELAARKRRRRESSLLTLGASGLQGRGAGGSGSPAVSLLARVAGKSTLGGG
jgi:hypothetical protein